MQAVAKMINNLAKKSDKACPIHHVNMLYVPDKAEPFCPLCEKARQDKAKQAFDRKTTRELTINFLYENSLLDRQSEWQHTFDNFKATKGSKEARLKHEAKLIAYRYLKEPKKKFNTLMFGSPGVGKTHLAMAMLKAVNNNAEPPLKCLFVNINTMFDHIYRSFDNSTELWTKEYAVETLQEPNLLVLDDLGTESAMSDKSLGAREFVQKLLYSITNTDTRLIVTTNLSLQQLERVYNAKIISRLRAGSQNSTLDFSGLKDKRY